jgi:NAD-dependent dihydropyrimidine dehydrogenase PreA subunit
MVVRDKSILERCNGCGICISCCPQDVFRLNEQTKKAIIKYPDDCVACWSCEDYCPCDCLTVTQERSREVPSPC